MKLELRIIVFRFFGTGLRAADLDVDLNIVHVLEEHFVVGLPEDVVREVRVAGHFVKAGAEQDFICRQDDRALPNGDDRRVFRSDVRRLADQLFIHAVKVAGDLGTVFDFDFSLKVHIAVDFQDRAGDQRQDDPFRNGEGLPFFDRQRVGDGPAFGERRCLGRRHGAHGHRQDHRHRQ